MRLLKQDRAGRWRDPETGRFAPAPLPLENIYQDRAGKWRDVETGRYAPAPETVLYQDRAGKWRDYDTGRFVSVKRYEAPSVPPPVRPVTVPPPVPEKPPVEAVPAVEYIDVGTPTWSTTDSPQLVPELYTNTSHFNSSYRAGDVLNIAEVYRKTFLAHANRSSLEPSDISIYQYGIQIRPREGEVTPEMISNIKDMMIDVPHRLIILQEDEGNSIRIVLGDPENPLDTTQVNYQLENYEELLSDIFNYIYDELGVCDWFDFFDTDEALYE